MLTIAQAGQRMQGESMYKVEIAFSRGL